jgi:glutamate synthase (NADPH) small chain
MDMKERLQIPRQPMPEQEAKKRARNFEEVPQGYSLKTAQTEALRCIQCKKPACVEGCPVEIDIPGFIDLISQGRFIEAAMKIKETNGLPAVCGRVCPQEVQCEEKCVRGKKGEPVAIGRLERFVADYEREAGEVAIPRTAPKTGRRVAVVGSGPSGLTVAADLVKLGHDVTIFEALHEPGGVLVYGIPEFRLPKAIVKAEVDYLRKLGVKIETSYVIGKLDTVDDLFAEGYDAVYLGTGAGLPTFMNIPGENLNGVYSANEYLTRSNLMKAYRFPEYDTPIVRGHNVAVVGGGNVAMDSARTAMRLGADHVYLVYRRSRTEMPARIEEIHHAEEEGIEFHLLTNPVRYIGNDKGWVVGVECLKMELGEPDESGRRKPVPMKGSEFIIDIDTAVVAIGAGSNPLVQSTTPGLKTNKWNYIVADEETGQTSREGVFAGGDIVTGAATVILAMGAGRKAARAIHTYIMSKE